MGKLSFLPGSETNSTDLRGKTFGGVSRRVLSPQPDQPDRTHHDAEQEGRAGNPLFRLGLAATLR